MTETNLNTIASRPVMIFDVDGTLTPDFGGNGRCMYSKGWKQYSEKYKNLEEVKLLQKFIRFLRRKGFIIYYNSNGYENDILNLFYHLGTYPNGGNSRGDVYGKTEYLEVVQKEYPNSKMYYAEDDKSYLSKSKLYNISCANGWWLGQQLNVILDCLKNEYILPEEVRDLYKLLHMLSDNVLKEFE